MSNKVSVVNGIVVVVMIFVVVWGIFFLAAYGAMKIADKVSANLIQEKEDADKDIIISELKNRSAGSCECTPIGDEWHCKSIETNKLYIIKKVKI